jgi:hypothetical protein
MFGGVRVWRQDFLVSRSGMEAKSPSVGMGGLMEYLLHLTVFKQSYGIP